MKVSELRLGNLVYDTKGNVNTVCVETFVKFNYQIQPITLTEEWLLRFGFGRDFEFDDHFIDNVSLKNEVIRYATDSNYFTIELYGGQVLEIPNIKHVHQLQNLYFALTGEELVLTDKQQEDEQP